MYCSAVLVCLAVGYTKALDEWPLLPTAAVCELLRLDSGIYSLAENSIFDGEFQTNYCLYALALTCQKYWVGNQNIGGNGDKKW